MRLDTPTRKLQEQQKKNIEKLKSKLRKENLQTVLSLKKVKFRDSSQLQFDQTTKSEQVKMMSDMFKSAKGEAASQEPGGSPSKLSLLKKKGVQVLKGTKQTKLVAKLVGVQRNVQDNITKSQENIQIQEKVRHAIENNNPMVIKDFVQFNVPMINMQDKEGYTMLALAVHYNRTEMVEILLKNGANANIKTYRDQNTPLHTAVYFNFRKIQDLLLESGADEHVVNALGLTPWEGVIPSKIEYN